MDKVKKEAIMNARTLDKLFLMRNAGLPELQSATSLMLMLRRSALQRHSKKNGAAPDLLKSNLQNALGQRKHIFLVLKTGSLTSD